MIQILTGDALAVLRGMEAGRFQTCITSPPYFSLRDYGVAGQIGLEATFEEWLEKLVAVFEEVRRVLRDDGTLWLNVGDSYTGGSIGRNDGDRSIPNSTGPCIRRKGLPKDECRQRPVPAGAKPKDLIGQPWRLAFALRDAGWYLRSEIIWHKPNPMPESVEDRPTKAHEQIFLLTKSARYFYDAEAIREPGTFEPGTERRAFTSPRALAMGRQPSGNEVDGWVTESGFRNKRTVWTVPSHAFSEAHFATFPPDLIIPCVKAGTSERGCCPECGAGWRRVVEREPDNTGYPNGPGGDKRNHIMGQHPHRGTLSDVARWRSETLGFRPTCEHGLDPVPCRVLDPFFGAGTTGLVADRLGRDCTGIELNPQYSAMAARRLRADCPLFTRVEVVK